MKEYSRFFQSEDVERAFITVYIKNATAEMTLLDHEYVTVDSCDEFYNSYIGRRIFLKIIII